MRSRNKELKTVQQEIKDKQAEINEIKPTLTKKETELSELVKLANYLNISPRVEYAREAQKHLFLVNGNRLYKVFSMLHKEKDGKEVRTLVSLSIDKEGVLRLGFDTYFFNTSYTPRGILSNQTDKKAVRQWGDTKAKLIGVRNMIEKLYEPKYQYDTKFKETLEMALSLYLKTEIEQHITYTQPA